MFTFLKNKDDTIVFNEDVKKHGGYLYTEKFSGSHTNRRLSDKILSVIDFGGKRVLDIGCGDGIYTSEIWERGSPRELVAIDPATEALKTAEEKYGKSGIKFRSDSIYNIPFPDGYFDIAVLRGVIHHLENPYKGIKEAVRVSKNIVMGEPNGYNPALQVLYKVSPYHIRHGELAYFPRTHIQWLEKAGARVFKTSYFGIVPMMFPEILARPLASIEPFFESLPVLRIFGCGLIVLAAKNHNYG